MVMEIMSRFPPRSSFPGEYPHHPHSSSSEAHPQSSHYAPQPSDDPQHRPPPTSSFSNRGRGMRSFVEGVTSSFTACWAPNISACVGGGTQVYPPPSTKATSAAAVVSPLVKSYHEQERQRSSQQSSSSSPEAAVHYRQHKSHHHPGYDYGDYDYAPPPPPPQHQHPSYPPPPAPSSSAPPSQEVELKSTISRKEQPMKDISSPSSNDVLCGRGGSSNRHEGNLHFRELVAANKKTYVTLTKKQKMMVARKIVSLIHTALPEPGRFLAKDLDTGLWYDIGLPRSLEKTSQALREKNSNDVPDDWESEPAAVITTAADDPSESKGKVVEAPPLTIPLHLARIFGVELQQQHPQSHLQHVPESPAPPSSKDVQQAPHVPASAYYNEGSPSYSPYKSPGAAGRGPPMADSPASYGPLPVHPLSNMSMTSPDHPHAHPRYPHYPPPRGYYPGEHPPTPGSSSGSYPPPRHPTSDRSSAPPPPPHYGGYPYGSPQQHHRRHPEEHGHSAYYQGPPPPPPQGPPPIRRHARLPPPHPYYSGGEYPPPTSSRSGSYDYGEHGYAPQYGASPRSVSSNHSQYGSRPRGDISPERRQEWKRQKSYDGHSVKRVASDNDSVSLSSTMQHALSLEERAVPDSIISPSMALQSRSRPRGSIVIKRAAAPPLPPQPRTGGNSDSEDNTDRLDGLAALSTAAFLKLDEDK